MDMVNLDIQKIVQILMKLLGDQEGGVVKYELKKKEKETA